MAGLEAVLIVEVLNKVHKEREKKLPRVQRYL